MYVRLASAWTDLSGAVHQAGDVIDVDVVTLAELEELGVVEEYDGSDGNANGTIDGTAHVNRIGPGPTAPGEGAESDTSSTTTKDSLKPKGLIGPGPTAPPPD